MSNSKVGKDSKPIVASGIGDESMQEMGSMQIVELTTKLNGVILRKAELQNNFEGVYLGVFERMAEFEAFGGRDMLEVLGDVGG